MMDPWFIEAIEGATRRGVPVFNVTQCQAGATDQTVYETGRALDRAGVIEGRDITTEAAVTKMMHVLGTEKDPDKVRDRLAHPLRGEMEDRRATEGPSGIGRTQRKGDRAI